jgi:excisionase family DNA binding protein
MSNSNKCRTLTIEEAAEELGISRGKGYDAAKSGEIPTIKIGRRLLVPRVALDRMLEGVSVAAGPKAAA